MTSQTSDAMHMEDWTGPVGARWLANIDRFESMIAPAGAALLAHAGYGAGESVVDIGCGGGLTTQAIARSVAPGGHVMGVDVAPDLVRTAQARAQAAGMDNIAFTCADAASVKLPQAPFDRLCSRFGSMFFPDPPTAFANLRGLLRPEGRIDLAVWAPPRDNPWMMEMVTAVRQHIDVPPAIPRAPGPFAFEEPDYMREVLEAAGFQDIRITGWEGPQHIGGAGATPAIATDFVLVSMAFADQIVAAGPDVAAAIRADLLALFDHHHDDRGVVMGAKIWLVSAHA